LGEHLICFPNFWFSHLIFEKLEKLEKVLSSKPQETGQKNTTSTRLGRMLTSAPGV